MADLAELPDLSQISDKAELLAELRDVQVPAVSSWPALGWWLLLFFIIACAVFIWIRKRNRARVQADVWRQEALTQLNELRQELNKASDTKRHQVIRDSSVLLRKVMMYVNGRTDVAGLTDTAWLEALHGHENVKALDPKLQPLITDAPYESEPSALMSEANVKALLKWLKRYINALPQVSAHDR